MNTLYDKLYAYSKSDYYPFHMPGHKRQVQPAKEVIPFGIDITEIEGFDDLHHAEGILLKAQKRAAGLYHADETYFLVNGSTVGILSAILGVTEKGDTILVARNCHKSVYHAIDMNELNPVYLYPSFDKEVHLNTEINPKDVEEALEENPDVRAVVIVSPTYDGVVSDVAAIADIVHQRGLPLIVDEAHGAHFGFHEYFPKNANQMGADVVIHSVHKTLPALTQTALLHMNGDRIHREKVRKYLHMLQTSSPSYVLMASIDACMEQLEQRKQEMFSSYIDQIEKAREELKGLKNLKLIKTEHFDKSKFVIAVKDDKITGKDLYEILLRDYHLQLEMAAGTYALAMTTVADTKEGLQRLTNALYSIDNRLDRKFTGEVWTYKEAKGGKKAVPGSQPKLEIVRRICDADIVSGGTKSLLWKDSAGYVSAEYAYLYPPGSPLIMPGERITKEAAELLMWYEEHGFSVEGLKRESYIEVLINE